MLLRMGRVRLGGWAATKRRGMSTPFAGIERGMWPSRELQSILTPLPTFCTLEAGMKRGGPARWMTWRPAAHAKGPPERPDASDGELHLVFLEGEAGLGKATIIYVLAPPSSSHSSLVATPLSHALPIPPASHASICPAEAPEARVPHVPRTVCPLLPLPRASTSAKVCANELALGQQARHGDCKGTRGCKARRRQGQRLLLRAVIPLCESHSAFGQPRIAPSNVRDSITPLPQPATFSKGSQVERAMLMLMSNVRLKYSTSVVRCHADPYSVRQRLAGEPSWTAVF